MSLRFPGPVCRFLNKRLKIPSGTLARVCPSTPGPLVAAKSGFDAIDGAAYLLKNAQPKSIGRCARYVTAAIAVGFGVDQEKVGPGSTPASRAVELVTELLAKPTISAEEHAKDYAPLLLALGFQEIGEVEEDSDRSEVMLPAGYTAQIGDIIIFQPNIPDGSIKVTGSGHMQMFTGTHWVSDFQQKTVLPHSSLDRGWHRTSFEIYRFPDK